MVIRGALVAVVLVACQAPAPGVGASCTRSSECASPLTCQFGRCRVECREQRDCPAAALCRVDAAGNGSCALVDDPDCRTSGCPTDLACVGTICVNLCDRVAECPAGSACAPTGDGRASCVRADVDAGAPTDDGGTDAAVDAGACLPPTCDPVVQLAAGDGFTCARTQSGGLWCWGADDEVARGGNGNVPGCDAMRRCPTPGPVMIERSASVHEPARGVSFVSAREYAACFVSAGEPVRCWANNEANGSLGNDGAGEYARVVRQQAGLQDPLPLTVTEVHVGNSSAIAVAPGTHWYAWGDDTYFQWAAAVPDPHDWAVEIAVPVATPTALRFGSRHACAITGGEVWCWGSDSHRQAGVTPFGDGIDSATPTRIDGIAGATEIALSMHGGCALAGDEVFCWGARESLGRSTAPVPSTCSTAGTNVGCTATQVLRSGAPFRGLAESGNADAACAIAMDGTLWCWGHDAYVSDWEPTLVQGLPTPVTAAVVTWSHTCAVAGGDVWCWGANDWGQSGRDTGGAAVDVPMPVRW